MSSILQAFQGPPKPSTHSLWFCAGPASLFPNLDSPSTTLASSAPPSCKVFHVPTSNGTATEVSLSDKIDESTDLRDQVLIFQYKGRFHAIDHQCPHASAPLSRGAPFDIEDFGVALSAGITCPKHNWSFDLFSGRADRGAYKLKIWEVEVRENGSGESGNGDGREVWVRRKQRMG